MAKLYVAVSFLIICLMLSSAMVELLCSAARPSTAINAAHLHDSRSSSNPNSAVSSVNVKDDDDDDDNNIAPIAQPVTLVYGQRTGRGTSEYWGKQAMAQNPPPTNSILGLLLSSVAKVLGPIALKYFGRTLTLLAALQQPPRRSSSASKSATLASDNGGDGYNSGDGDGDSDVSGNTQLLLRESVAAFLNSMTVSGFPMSADDIEQSFNSAAGDDAAALAAATQLQLYNEAV